MFQESLRDFHTSLVLYVYNHGGDFPESKQDLIDKGYLRIIEPESDYPGKEIIKYRFPTLGWYINSPGLSSDYDPLNEKQNEYVFWRADSTLKRDK